MSISLLLLILGGGLVLVFIAIAIFGYPRDGSF